MTLQVLRAADHRCMPWKNGRGETTEIAIWPPTAGLDGFDWRISMAGVAEDGDFSIFPQIDRSLAVLSGDGIELQVQGLGLHRLTLATPPLAFAADVPASARLLGQPITDLNVMTRRGSWSHRLLRGTDDPGPDTADWTLVLAARALELPGPAGPLTLAPLDALLCHGPASGVFPPRIEGAWRVQISRT
ncbi:HutD/Ves family protein [Paracoccus limosus]|uniref:HutD/Ves family protein n=1 Tax=Paracoccus limosus TaxID=913252 RepID=UPI001B871E85|nr:HutD family protein [Paracoccus limosus]